MRTLRIMSTASVAVWLIAAASPVAAAVPGETRTNVVAFPGSNGRIAFESGRTDEFDIYSLLPDGTGLIQLTSGIREDHAPRWSPDGTRIAYYRSFFDGPGNLWVMNADGSNKQRLTSGPADDRDPAWSPDGTTLVFTRATKKGVDLFTIGCDGTGLDQLTSHHSADFASAWSTSDRIVFTSLRSGGGDLYVIDPGGSTAPTRLTHGPREDLYGTWSPDGSQIAFFRQLGPMTSDRELYVIAEDGTGLQRLTDNDADDSFPTWAPDGTLIVFDSDRKKGFYDLYTMNPDGTGAAALLKDAFLDGRPDWQSL